MRRKKTSTFLGLINLPWWVSLILAASVWLLPKLLIANIGMDTPASPLDQAYRQAVLQVIPSVAPFFAIIFCFTAVASAFQTAFQSWRRGTLFRSQTSLQNIRDLSWQDFERYIAEAYRQKGYSVEETGLGGTDGGIDLIVKKKREVFLVQCKHWRYEKVGVRIAREFFGVVKAHNATGGMLVASGEFTEEAREFAKQTKLDLIDGKRLISMISRVEDISSPPIGKEAAPPGESAPSCPKCNAPMVGRTAKKGRHAGQSFWGCSRYPICRGIREWTPASPST